MYRGLRSMELRRRTGLHQVLSFPNKFHFSRSNESGSCISLAEKIKQQIANGQYSDATETWSKLESVISENSNSVVSRQVNV